MEVTALMDISEARSRIRGMNHDDFESDATSHSRAIEEILRRSIDMHSRRPCKEVAEDLPSLRQKLRRKGIHAHDLSFRTDDTVSHHRDEDAYDNLEDVEGIPSPDSSDSWDDVEADVVNLHLPIFRYRDGGSIRYATYTQLLSLLEGWTVGEYRRPPHIDAALIRVCESLEREHDGREREFSSSDRGLSSVINTLRIGDDGDRIRSMEIMRDDRRRSWAE